MARHKHITKKQSKQQRTALDIAIYFFTFATPLFEIPQALTIYQHHNAADVSIYTWGFFLIDNIAWIIYGIKRNMKPLVITSILYLVIESSVVIGILRYT